MIHFKRLVIGALLLGAMILFAYILTIIPNWVIVVIFGIVMAYAFGLVIV